MERKSTFGNGDTKLLARLERKKIRGEKPQETAGPGKRGERDAQNGFGG